MATSFLKKIRHIIDSKVSTYIFKRYPMFIAFLRRYTEFMDLNYTIEALNFDNNNSPDEMFERFLDESWNQYCIEMFDRDEFGIDDDTDLKRLFLSLSKLLYQNKGKSYSFDVILRYLTKFTSSGNSEISDGIDYVLSEDEQYWHSKYEGSIEGYYSYAKPYTFRIEIDNEDRRIIQSLIEKYTPMGFWMIWVYAIQYDDIVSLNSIDELIQNIQSAISDNISVTLTDSAKITIGNHFSDSLTAVNKYDGTFDYDGQIDHNYVRSYVIEEIDVTYHDTLNPDINENWS